MWKKLNKFMSSFFLEKKFLVLCEKQFLNRKLIALKLRWLVRVIVEFESTEAI